MWIKFLVDCRCEGDLIAAGSVYWAEKAGVIRKTDQYQQTASALAIEAKGRLLVLPDDATGELYVPSAELPGHDWTVEEILAREG